MLADLIPLFTVLLFLKVIFSFIHKTFLPTNSQVKSVSSEKPIKSINDMDMSYLNQSLKNLEYINQFEHYLSCREDSDFSSEFLQSFNQLKIDAQLATLNSTNALMKKVKTAA